MNLVLPDLNHKGDPDFFTMGIFGGLSLITAFLLKQSLPIASSLSGGLTLSALSHVGSMVSSTLKAIGVAPAAKSLGKGLKAAGDAMAKKATGQKQSTVNSAVEQGKNENKSS